MVGPGTGVVPFIGMSEERELLRKEKNVATGEGDLFFGCRSRDQDFIYEDEMRGFVNSGVVTALHTAFSREQEKKIYVQDLFYERKEEMYKKLFEQQGQIYMCGAVQMGKQMHRLLERIVEEVEKCSPEQAAEKVKSLDREKRYAKELW